MMTNDEQIKFNKRQRFEVMAVRLANHLNLSVADTFVMLPEQVKIMLNGLKYLDVVLPLMQHDRDRLSLSYRQLEIKYGVPKSTIQMYLNGPKK